MDEIALRELLELVREKTVPVDDAIQAMRRLPFEDLGLPPGYPSIFTAGISRSSVLPWETNGPDYPNNGEAC